MNSIQQMNLFLKGVQELRDKFSLFHLEELEKAQVAYAIEAIEEVTGVTLRHIQSNSRKRFIVDARIILSFYLRNNLKYTFQKIGLIQLVDHTTIVNHIKAYHQIKNDHSFKSKYLGFRKLIRKNGI